MKNTQCLTCRVIISAQRWRKGRGKSQEWIWSLQRGPILQRDQAVGITALWKHSCNTHRTPTLCQAASRAPETKSWAKNQMWSLPTWSLHPAAPPLSFKDMCFCVCACYFTCRLSFFKIYFRKRACVCVHACVHTHVQGCIRKQGGGRVRWNLKETPRQSAEPYVRLHLTTLR